MAAAGTPAAAAPAAPLAAGGPAPTPWLAPGGSKTNKQVFLHGKLQRPLGGAQGGAPFKGTADEAFESLIALVGSLGEELENISDEQLVRHYETLAGVPPLIDAIGGLDEALARKASEFSDDDAIHAVIKAGGIFQVLIGKEPHQVTMKDVQGLLVAPWLL